MNITKEQLENLYYVQKLSQDKISILLNCSQSWIYKLFKKYNIEARKSKYTYNTEYFHNININNAYWAGWLASDGCISTGSHNTKILRLALQLLDIEVLNKFKESVNFTGNVETSKIRNIQQKKYPNCKLVIHGIHHNWSKDLENNFNIIPNKTFCLKEPNISNIDCKLSYIKGFAEGDGCVCLSYPHGSIRPFLQFKITGASYTVLSWISDILEPYAEDRGKIHQTKNYYDLFYRLQPSIKIINLFNNIQTPYHLSRKWGKVKEYNSVISSL